MPRTTPMLGYPTMAAACEALRAQGLHYTEIAEKIGRKPVQVRATLSSRDYAKAPRTIVLSMELAAKLSDPAAARDLTVPELVERLIDVVADDEVIDALLGEPGEIDG